MKYSVPIGPQWPHSEVENHEADKIRQGDSTCRDVCPGQQGVLDLRTRTEMKMWVSHRAPAAWVPVESQYLWTLILLQSVPVGCVTDLPRAPAFSYLENLVV